MPISTLKRIDAAAEIQEWLGREIHRTGGLFRLAPAWVGRPGIIQPGRRIKLADDYISQDVAVNERWLASTTYADNGVYNSICPEDHGLSYFVIGEARVQMKEAVACAGDLLLDGRPWDVLPKFFDNWHRIPHHMHPCQEHAREGLTGKPESYYFPPELNQDRNAFPATPMGVDASYSDGQVLNYLQRYFKGDNRLTDLANTINLIPGTGWFMPPCTLHAPGSLVTYELQVASDVTCIPESRVNDVVMPPDLIDRDLPVTIKKDGFAKTCDYMLSMIRCKNAGNSENFRSEYFRPPVLARKEAAGEQYFVIYRCGRASEAVNPDLYSAKKTVVFPGQTLQLNEKAAFGVIILRGHGCFAVPGKAAVSVESTSLYTSRDEIGGDELFVSAPAAKALQVTCDSIEPLVFCQHFASNSNPESASLAVEEFRLFADDEQV